MQQIATAFVKAQAAFAPALKQSLNPHFRSKYVDLAGCVEAVIDALNENGIALIQQTHECNDGVIVETLLLHESGETITGGKLHLPATKSDPQGFASALTYARRYSLMATCGIAPEDDDGNAATKARQAQNAAPKAMPRVEPNGSITATLNPPAGDVTVTPSVEDIARATEIIKGCKTLINLQVEWEGLPKEVQKAVIAVKDEVKATLLAAQPKAESKA